MRGPDARGDPRLGAAALDTLEALRANLLSPPVLAIAVGLLAYWAKSDLKLPAALYDGLTLYLMLAIGLKGGVALAKTPAAELWRPALGALLVGATVPCLAFAALRRLGKMAQAEASAIAAHYGSVSAVTFIAATNYLRAAGIPAEGYAPALLALLEIPGIVVALALGHAGKRDRLGATVHELVTGRSIVLLGGGLAIGAVAGPELFAPVAPFFVDLFPGVLVLFLLELGRLAAERLVEARRAGAFLVVFGLVAPIVQGSLGALVGAACGLSVGGTTLLATLAASASYIAAPAAVRAALPEVNLALCLGPALGVTFPFNLAIGIPLYHELATRLAGG